MTVASPAGIGDAPGGAGSLCIGLMSGTSLDGVDGVLVDFAPANVAAQRLPLHVLAHAYRALPDALAADLLALNTSGADELHRAALAANALVEVYTAVVGELLASAGRTAADVAAIGAHGQTVRHRPQAFDGIGYTLQLNNPALLAERCGIDVVADFRSRDVVAGGQGAPLVPAFHRAVFGVVGEPRAVLNLGGIANLTVLAADGSTTGFDCGPANALLDDWCRRHQGGRFDDGGRWAAGGRLLPTLFDELRREPFFDLPPPKSTGRDLFNAGWLNGRLAAVAGGSGSVDARDVQHTLAELTAWSSAEAVRRHAPGVAELLVCGGGALNDHLMHRLLARLPTLRVRRSDDAGLPCQHVEAAAFAWLAWRFLNRQPGNVVGVTGAGGPRVLGALYPA